MASTKKEFVEYTEKELAAIEALANAGEGKTGAELGVSTATLESLIKKANDERPMAEGVDRVIVTKEKVTRPVTVEKEVTLYSIVK